MTVRGAWISGPFVGRSGTALAVDDDAVIMVDDDGRESSGAAAWFRASSGEIGEAVLELLLPRPNAAALEYGAVRESLAHAMSVALVGDGETRCWDSLVDYVCDDGEGRWCVVSFQAGAAVAAFATHRRAREFDVDRALAQMPEPLRADALRLSALPLMNGAVAAVGWSEHGPFETGEPWHRTFAFGGQLLQHEFLPDHEWVADARDYYGLDDVQLRALVPIARRAQPGKALALTEAEWRLIVPADAPHHDNAVARLLPRVTSPGAARPRG